MEYLCVNSVAGSLIGRIVAKPALLDKCQTGNRWFFPFGGDLSVVSVCLDSL